MATAQQNWEHKATIRSIHSSQERTAQKIVVQPELDGLQLALAQHPPIPEGGGERRLLLDAGHPGQVGRGPGPLRPASWPQPLPGLSSFLGGSLVQRCRRAWWPLASLKHLGPAHSSLPAFCTPRALTNMT